MDKGKESEKKQKKEHSESRSVRVWREPGRWNRLQHLPYNKFMHIKVARLWFEQAFVSPVERTPFGYKAAMKYRDEVHNPLESY